MMKMIYDAKNMNSLLGIITTCYSDEGIKRSSSSPVYARMASLRRGGTVLPTPASVPAYTMGWPTP